MAARTVLAVLAGVLVLTSSVFLSPVSSDGDVDPVAFEDTIVLTDLTDAERRTADERGLVVPRAQVFYSTYRYVVGYEGMSSLATSLSEAATRRQFGDPLDVLVEEYGGAELELTDEGYLRKTGGVTRWVPVERVSFVVGSAARRPGGEIVVPFANRADAAAFVDAHGGEIVDWSGLRTTSFEAAELSPESGFSLGAERAAWADRATATARRLTDRPVSVVVGEDAPTLAAALERAPPNTTVRLPRGRYDQVNVTVEKPVTIAGAGRNATTLVGTANGSVLRATGAAVGVTDLAIEGVGDATAAPNASVDADRWDALVMRSYAHAASGIEVANGSGSYVADVAIETPANGVTVRYSDGVVVERVHVRGSERPLEGFMATLAAHSRVVVQDSRVEGGRDGVYLHVADGTVVRDNAFADLRFGVHEMYTSNTLVAHNAVTDAGTGIVVMTRPEHNVVLGNAVRDSSVGIDVAGRSSYVLGNVVVGNDLGLDVGSYRSLYARNTVYDNGVGVRGSTLVPTNVVVANDVVGNDRFASTVLGPVRVWTVGGRGNYWAGAPGSDRDGDGVLERSFRPTGPVDRHAGTVRDVHVLARSPALGLVRSGESAMPGLRPRGVLDAAPLAGPVRPGVLATVRARPDAAPSAWVNATGTPSDPSGLADTARVAKARSRPPGEGRQ